MNIEHFVGLIYAFNGADVNTRRVLSAYAGFSNNMGHAAVPP